MTNRTFWRWCYASARDAGLGMVSSTECADEVLNRSLFDVGRYRIDKANYPPKLPERVQQILKEEIQRAMERSGS